MIFQITTWIVIPESIPPGKQCSILQWLWQDRFWSHNFTNTPLVNSLDRQFHDSISRRKSLLWTNIFQNWRCVAILKEGMLRKSSQKLCTDDAHLFVKLKNTWNFNREGCGFCEFCWFSNVVKFDRSSPPACKFRIFHKIQQQTKAPIVVWPVSVFCVVSESAQSSVLQCRWHFYFASLATNLDRPLWQKGRLVLLFARYNT